MGFDAISVISSYNAGAVNSVSRIGNKLSEETIKKLKALGIDPSKVHSESEAQQLIQQAQSQQNVKSSAQVGDSNKNSNIDVQQLRNDMNVLGAKVGIDVSNAKTLDDAVNKLEAGVKEYTKAASGQVNVSDHTQKVQNNNIQSREDKNDIQNQFQDIKNRVDELKASKNAMFVGQDMMSMLNRFSLGI